MGNQTGFKQKLSESFFSYLLIGFLLCSFTTVYGQTYSIPPQIQTRLKIKHLTTKEGLSQGVLRCIMQDKQGFIWLATLGGLNRYDGVNFKAYTHEETDSMSLSNDHVNTIYQTKDGDIWVGTSNGLNKVDIKTGKIAPFGSIAKGQKKDVTSPPPNQIYPQLSNGFVSCIYQDDAEALWIGTGNGLNCLVTPLTSADAVGYHYYLPKHTINSIYKDRQGVLWVATQKGLYYANTKTHEAGKLNFTRYKSESFTLTDLTQIYEDSKGRFWVGDHQGHMALLNRKTGEVHEDKVGVIAKIWSILEDQNGVLWVGTSHKLLWYDEENKTFKEFLHPEVKISGAYALYEDRSGVLWLGTSGGGLYQIDSKSYKFGFMHPSGFDAVSQRSDNVWKMYAKKDILLMLTNGKGLFQVNRKTGKTMMHTHNASDPQSISNDKIYRLYEDKQGDIWAGSIDGLNKFDIETGKFRRYYIENKHSIGYWISAIFEDSSGNFWVASGWHGLYKLNRKTGTFKKVLKLDKNQRIRTICEDNQGRLWMSQGSFLGVFDPNEKNEEKQYRTYTSEDKNSGIKGSTIMHILKTRSGQLWIGTYGNGLGKVTFMKDGSFQIRYYEQKDGLPGSIYTMEEDGQGNLWISTNKGLSQFNPKTETFKNYTEMDGLQSDDFSQGSHYKNTETGELFFGGSNGITHFYPDKVKDNTYLPPIVLTDFQLANKSIELLQAEQNIQSLPFIGSVNKVKKIVLTYEQAIVFSFEFAALSYASSEDNQYKVKMEGYDKDWRNLGNRNFVTYTGIPHGTYTFKVQGSNHDEIWNTEGLAIELIILPAWWQTWWFRVSWISLIVLAAFGFYQYRTTTIRRQKRVLEHKVEERTKEIAEKNTVLQTQKGEIVAQNEELQQQSEEIMAQRDAIEAQNKTLTIQNHHIKQSIKSAQTIQEAILPFEQRMQEELTEYFVLFRPRDVVSGDFYLMEKIENKITVAAIDCTGHGVPGAFMSLIGYALLNEIIKAKQITDPGEILEKLRFELRNALKQDKTGDQNGMDVAMVTIEYTNKEEGLTKVLFAGAKRPLLYIDANKEMQRVKGSNVSIGIDYKDDRKITTKELYLPKGNILYLSSDGFADQNDTSRKKFGNKRIQDILIANCHLPLPEQKKVLDETLDQFMKGVQQRDDILLMGVKL
ncbi:MAG: two-component regulator propeller domain-containing protein [Flammeovirgaceae bacterium]